KRGAASKVRVSSRDPQQQEERVVVGSVEAGTVEFVVHHVLQRKPRIEPGGKPRAQFSGRNVGDFPIPAVAVRAAAVERVIRGAGRLEVLATERNGVLPAVRTIDANGIQHVFGIGSKQETAFAEGLVFVN